MSGLMEYRGKQPNASSRDYELALGATSTVTLGDTNEVSFVARCSAMSTLAGTFRHLCSFTGTDSSGISPSLSVGVEKNGANYRYCMYVWTAAGYFDSVASSTTTSSPDISYLPMSVYWDDNGSAWDARLYVADTMVCQRAGTFAAQAAALATWLDSAGRPAKADVSTITGLQAGITHAAAPTGLVLYELCRHGAVMTTPQRQALNTARANVTDWGDRAALWDAGSVGGIVSG